MNVQARYYYRDAAPIGAHGYLWNPLQREIEKRSWSGKRAFDLGCGNGATANMLSTVGFDVTGVDPSEPGIALARAAYPHIRCELGNGSERLEQRYGTFPLVISLEVIEHVYEPHTFAKTLYSLVEPGGLALISTPYHGYLKNLALALTGRLDKHFTALWDGGHIKFWSRATLTKLLHEAGFKNVRIVRVGRVPVLAKSMMAIATK